MVKRGIGAVVLAIIAALLLGYLLKDKSRERQDIVEMTLPGAPEINIPSLSDVTDGATNLVDGAKDAVSNTGKAVIASTSGALGSLGDGAAKTTEAVTDDLRSAAKAVTETTDKAEVTEKVVAKSSNEGSANPGFSFRPPQQNEEQQINTSGSSAPEVKETAETSKPAKEEVVASTAKPKEEKKFKPTLENEPEKKTVAKAVVKKQAAPKKAVANADPKPKAATAKPAATSTSGGKYSIQLLATSSQSRANKLAKTMNSEGYVSFITQTKNSNKTLYRVRVGGHKDRNAALSAQKTMKRRYQKNFFVQNSLVVSQ